MNQGLIVAGRIAIAAIFLWSGFRKVTGFEGVVNNMASKGIPLTEVLAVGAIAFEILGGLMVATGFRPRIGALLLVVFLVPVTVIFHPITDPQQQSQFMKNLAILGGLLVLASTTGKEK